MLKAKLAKLRREILEPKAAAGGGKGEGFDVTKVGDSRVGLVGFPSVGKSTLLNKLTGTFSEVASYEFTTLTCIPGVIRHQGAKIQLLDLPGIIEGAKDGKGRGRQVISTARTCNLILIVLDALKPITHKRLIEHELEGFGIRLNQEPPKITFKRKERGGVSFASTVHTTHLDLETVTQILKEYRIHNADIRMQGDYTDEDLIDVIEGNRVYIPAIYVCNKIDQITLEELELLDRMPHYCPISAHAEWNMDGLLEMARPRGRLPPSCAQLTCASIGVGVPGPSAHLHQAQGPEPGLQRARHPAARRLHGGGLLQPHPQGPAALLQVRHRVGRLRQARAAAGGQGARALGRGCGADCEEGVGKRPQNKQLSD